MRPEPREYCVCQHVCHMYQNPCSGPRVKGRKHAVSEAARSSLDLARQTQFLNASCVWSSTLCPYDPPLNDHCPFPSCFQVRRLSSDPKFTPNSPNSFILTSLSTLCTLAHVYRICGPVTARTLRTIHACSGLGWITSQVCKQRASRSDSLDTLIVNT